MLHSTSMGPPPYPPCMRGSPPYPGCPWPMKPCMHVGCRVQHRRLKLAISCVAAVKQAAGRVRLACTSVGTHYIKRQAPTRRRTP